MQTARRAIESSTAGRHRAGVWLGSAGRRRQKPPCSLQRSLFFTISIWLHIPVEDRRPGRWHLLCWSGSLTQIAICPFPPELASSARDCSLRWASLIDARSLLWTCRLRPPAHRRLSAGLGRCHLLIGRHCCCCWARAPPFVSWSSIGQIGRCRSDRDIYYWNRHALAKLLKATKEIQSAEIPQLAEAEKTNCKINEVGKHELVFYRACGCISWLCTTLLFHA
jgi:hypothetical protein